MRRIGRRFKRSILGRHQDWIDFPLRCTYIEETKWQEEFLMLGHAFRNCNIGVYLRFQTTGKVSDLRRFRILTEVFQKVLCELFHADHADLVAHIEDDIETIMNLLLMHKSLLDLLSVCGRPM